MRWGADFSHPKHPDTGAAQHTLMPVMKEMILQITRDYGGLPDVRTLSASEIRFFYEGLRPELREQTKPRPRPRK